MRIIDKCQDYYDYLQDSTDTLVFDRRGSFILDKQMLISNLSRLYYDQSDNQFLLVQCGATFWLIFVKLIKDKNKSTHIGVHDDYVNYDLELLATWKNYNKENKLLYIEQIQFKELYKIYRKHTIDIAAVRSNINDLISAVNNNDYEMIQVISRNIKYTSSKGWSSKKEVQTIPILKASGIQNVIDALSMFTAIEEYFSIEKTKAERTEAIGTTNNDKIVMHGFDTKTSFRGKVGK